MQTRMVQDEQQTQNTEIVQCSTRPAEIRTQLQSILLHKLQHELLSNNSPPCIDRDLHAADLLVDVFHKLYDEINQLVLPELFQVRVRDEEADIEPLVNAHCRHPRWQQGN